MFRDRYDAACRLASRLRERPLRDSLVLAIPRGGVVIGATLADELGADLDVILSRKLGAPGQPDLALGAVAETGEVYLDRHAAAWIESLEEHLDREELRQLDEIARQRQLYREGRPPKPVEGRSVIVTDDGIATGSTMIAALKVLARRKPHEVLVAVPVSSADRLVDVRRWCSDLVCLLAPQDLRAVGHYYSDFSPVEDGEVRELLRPFVGEWKKEPER